MRQFVDAWLGPRCFNLGLFGAFASTAVLLAVLGLCGLVSYTVSARASEIGLRMAIGATQGKVKRMILGQAARLAVAGVTAGLALAAAVRPLISRVIASRPATTPTEDVWIDPPRAAAVASPFHWSRCNRGLVAGAPRGTD